MNVLINKFLLGLLITSLVLINCDNNPFNVNGKNASGIVVILKDEHGNPVGGASVYTYPKTINIKTANYGQAIIDDIPARDYGVYCDYTDTEQNISMWFVKNIMLKRNQNLEIRFSFPSKIVLQVVVLTKKPADTDASPIPNVEIKTNPETYVILTDENGQAIFENILFKKYEFIITTKKKTYSIKPSMFFVNGQAENIIITLDLKAPLVRIMEPGNRYYQKYFNVHLIGDGTDYEYQAMILILETALWNILLQKVMKQKTANII